MADPFGLTLTLFSYLNEDIKMSSVCGSSWELTVDYTLRNISMDAVKISQVIVKNIIEVQAPVRKVPGSGSRGQSASVHVYVGRLQAEGNTMGGCY